jgi:hypothetical protein
MNGNSELSHGGERNMSEIYKLILISATYYDKDIDAPVLAYAEHLFKSTEEDAKERVRQLEEKIPEKLRKILPATTEFPLPEFKISYVMFGDDNQPINPAN